MNNREEIYRTVETSDVDSKGEGQNERNEDWTFPNDSHGAPKKTVAGQ